MLQVEPAMQWDPAMIAGVGSVAIDRLEQLYYRMYSYLADSGVDGVKVDAQSGIGSFGSGNGGGSNIARASVTAMEKNVRLFFGNPVIKSALGSDENTLGSTSTRSSPFRLLPMIQSIRNRLFYRKSRPDSVLNATTATPDLSPVSLVGCMCHSTENLFNFYETSLVRVSDDFYPKDEASQTVHLASCAYNSVMIGEIAIADFDMFHSQHACAEMHAAARAISGGPVYVSDSPGKHNATLLSRLVLPNGRVLRTMLPARPTVDCLFKDVMNNGKTALKIWSLNRANAVLGIFHVQGASWNGAKRIYEIHDRNPPMISVDCRPRDLPFEFASLDFERFAHDSKHLYESESSSHQVSQPAVDPLRLYRDKQKKIIRTVGSSANQEVASSSQTDKIMFLAWSSAHRRLHFMSSKNDGIKQSLRASRDWDIITFCHLHSIPCKSAAMESSEVKHTVIDPDTKPFIKIPIPSGIAQQAFVKGVTDLFSQQHTKVNYTAEERFFQSSFGTRQQHSDVDNKKDRKSETGVVYWAPIGLLDMLNGGGAVEDIVPVAAGSTSIAPIGVFSVRGPGRLGLFCSKLPSRILIDGTQLPVESVNNEPQSFGGYLVSFELPSQGNSDRLLTVSGSGMAPILGIDMNKEYALCDKLRVVSVCWS
jgi:hypothetical protein